MVEYPSAEKIIEFNLLALSVIKIKRSDSAKVLSRTKILNVINSCKSFEGDLYDKAVVLLKGIIQGHPFASGNRRTAFITTKYFLVMNNRKLGIKDNPENAKVLLGIREGYYSDEEIKEWLKNGKTKEFKR
ncbi:type II toxin-antitoxin system death-on-curing family toxin [Candidatus Micrarchaeota archaeon]|nr:type II toxin-antitoxin system death-on-curing family toxin [Candidatus Micrarchaeota archaeon]MBU2476005.1 type II toxin-antitoxin system death-on-curing family toxin [Candidatus Micrarchaeota archaeon]